MIYLNKIISWYAHRKVSVLIAMAVIGSIMFPLHYWFYGFLYFHFFLFPVLGTTHHEFLAHEYIKPKNLVVECFLLFYFIAYVFTGLKNKKGYHILHHKFENTEKDPTGIKLNSCSTFQYIFDLGPAKELGIDLSMPNLVTSEVRTVFDKHWLKIAICVQIIWLLFFPLWTWFTFYVYPLIMLELGSRLVEIYYHKYNKDDFPPFALAFGGAGWHKTHHLRWREYYLGDGPWLRVNTQYYAAKLLFTPVK